MITVGLDAGRDAHRYLVVTPTKDEVDGGLVPNKTWAYEGWAMQVEQFGTEVRLVVESGNGLSAPIEQFVLARGWQVLSITANAVRSYRENVMALHDKTDKSDAEAIAKLGVELKSRLSSKLQPRRELRRLVRQRASLVKQATCTRNRLRQAIAEVWPELDTKVIPTLGRPLATWLLATHPDPREIAHLGVDNLAVLMRAARLQPRKAFLHKIVDLAQRYQCSLPAEEAKFLFAEIRLLAKRLQHILDDIVGLEELIQQRTSKDSAVQSLLTIPGCGPVIASSIMAEIQDVQNFATEAQLASYAGLALRRHQTGKSANYRLPQLRANRHLKRALLLLAFRNGKCNPQSAAYLAKKRTSGKKSLQAQRSLGRQLVRVVHSILKSSRPYRAQ